VTSPDTAATGTVDLPGYAPIPAIAKGTTLNEHGYHVWQVERNLYAVTDNVYMSAFLTTPDGVVIFDAPPNIGHNITTQTTRERPRCSAGTSSASATRRPGACCCATTTRPAPSLT
jgi:hypothetical protein